MRRLLIVVALAWALGPSSANAEWLFTPNIGGVFGGPAAGGATWGATIGWMGDGVFGAEADLGFASNNLLTTNEANFLGIDRDFFDAEVSTVMGNVVVGYPIGGTTGKGVNPFFAAGLGLIQSNVQGAIDIFDSSQSNFGLSLGTGAFGFVTDTIGFRGDVRWYYSITDPDLELDLRNAAIDIPLENIDRDFWRATGGVTFRW
jgi:hypothetical protein